MVVLHGRGNLTYSKYYTLSKKKRPSSQNEEKKKEKTERDRSYCDPGEQKKKGRVMVRSSPLYNSGRGGGRRSDHDLGRKKKKGKKVPPPGGKGRRKTLHSGLSIKTKNHFPVTREKGEKKDTAWEEKRKGGGGERNLPFTRAGKRREDRREHAEKTRSPSLTWGKKGASLDANSGKKKKKKKIGSADPGQEEKKRKKKTKTKKRSPFSSARRPEKKKVFVGRGLLKKEGRTRTPPWPRREKGKESLRTACSSAPRGAPLSRGRERGAPRQGGKEERGSFPFPLSNSER